MPNRTSTPRSARPQRTCKAPQPMCFAVGTCARGARLVAQSGRGVCAIALGDDPDALVDRLQARFPHAGPLQDDPALEAVLRQVIAFVEAPHQDPPWPLDIGGTAFQQQVWQALQAIAPGQTASYADIAQSIGAPRAVRAVASACADNTLAVVIPCHREVRQDGLLSGYRWGIERKRALLACEAQALQTAQQCTVATKR